MVKASNRFKQPSHRLKYRHIFIIIAATLMVFLGFLNIQIWKTISSMQIYPYEELDVNRTLHQHDIENKGNVNTHDASSKNGPGDEENEKVIISEIDKSMNEEANSDKKVIAREEVESVRSSSTNEDPSTVERKDNRQLIFIMVGAVRAIEKTALLTLQNLVAPLCPPLSCTSHLVTHLSYTDNRPDEGGRDPKGRSITLEETTIERTKSFMQQAFCSSSKGIGNQSQTVGFHMCHTVSPAYDIGSDQEQRAMDDFESEFSIKDPALQNRIRSLRYGDPRRYSMWFARNYAWRFVEKTFLSTNNQESLYPVNLQFMFVRPDLLWYLPFAPWEYLQSNIASDRDIWIHDSYYANIPDTWAFLPNVNVAQGYFSLLDIIQDGVACLGGPDFDKSLAEKRLITIGILNSTGGAGENMVIKWCNEDRDPSWSEEILLSKLRRLKIQHRFIPAGVSLLRTEKLDCQPIHPYFKLDDDSNHARTFVPVLKCFMIGKHFFHDQGEALLQRINSIEIFRIRASWNDTVCLAELDDHGSLGIQSCQEHPPLQTQLFASSAHVNGLYTLWGRDVFQNVSSLTNMLEPWTAWRKDFFRPFDQMKSLELRRGQ